MPPTLFHRRPPVLGLFLHTVGVLASPSLCLCADVNGKSREVQCVLRSIGTSPGASLFTRGKAFLVTVAFERTAGGGVRYLPWAYCFATDGKVASSTQFGSPMASSLSWKHVPAIGGGRHGVKPDRKGQVGGDMESSVRCRRSRNGSSR